jgi:hypothetical protein
VNGSVEGNTICIDLPLNAFGPARPIGATSTFYNVTAFSGGRNDVAADVYTEGDSTRSFDFALGNSSPKVGFSVASRKVHGSAGTFDINLPLTGPRGVECRAPGQTGTAGVDYKMIFTFSAPVTACGTASTGTVVSGPNANQCTVNLTGLANQTYITVTLTGVTNACFGALSPSPSGTMGLLVGDVNASGVVTSGDTNLCKAQALQPVTNSNFRNDINASGSITTGDVNLIKQNALSQLPTPP